MLRARFASNPYRETGPFPGPPRRAVRDFHRTVPGYQPTPLISRPDLARQLGVGEVLIKYEGARFGLMAFKALGASWALHRLLQDRPGGFTTVATASEGNHGRAVAWSARLLGLPCVIFLPAQAAPERVANIRNEGARVVLVDGTYEDAVRRCDEESRREGWQVVSDVGYPGYVDIPLLVVEGYSTLFDELDEQLAAAGGPAPAVVLIPGGVGGLLHAGAAHYGERQPSPRVLSVEPIAGDCLFASITSPGGQPSQSAGNRTTSMACLNCAEVSLSSWPAIRRGVDGFVAIDDGYADEAVRRLHRNGAGGTAIDAGQSGAAATGALIALMEEPSLAGARERLALDANARVVVICTEGPIDRAQFERALSGA